MCHSLPLRHHRATRKSSNQQSFPPTSKKGKCFFFVAFVNVSLTLAAKERVKSHFVRVRDPLFPDKLWLSVSFSGWGEVSVDKLLLMISNRFPAH